MTMLLVAMRIMIMPILAYSLVNADTENTDESSCCRQNVYPEGKIWISNENRKTNFTLYDTHALVTKIYTYNVDPLGTVITNRKVLEATSGQLKCPKGYITSNPEHKDLMKLARAQMLCLHQAPQQLKSNQWYVMCRERTCTSCSLDKTVNSMKNVEYVKVQSMKVDGENLVAQLNVVEPGMRYNVTMEIGVSRDTLTNATIPANQNGPFSVTVPNVLDIIYRYPIYLIVQPWAKSSETSCPVVGRKQITVLSPLKRPKTGSSY